jgi:hypothetical protein
MTDDWTLLNKAAAGLILTEADRVTWQVLSARAHAAQRALMDPEGARILAAMAALVAQRARIVSVLAARAQGAKILSAPRPLARLALTEAESENLAELNHLLGSAIRFKFREGKWQFGWSKPGDAEPPPVPDFWRQLPIHIDPFGSSMTWQGETLSPVLVRDVAPVGAAEAPEPAGAPRQASEQSGSTASQPQGKRGRPPGSPERDRIVKAIRKDIYEEKTHALGRNRSGGPTLVELLGDGKTGPP